VEVISRDEDREYRVHVRRRAHISTPDVKRAQRRIGATHLDVHLLRFNLGLVGALGGLVLIALNLLSIRWLRSRERTFLRRALKRRVKPLEEDSLSVWLKVPSQELDTEIRELEKDPYNAVPNAWDNAPAVPAEIVVVQEPQEREAMIRGLQRRVRLSLVLWVALMPVMLALVMLVRPIEYGVPMAVGWLLMTLWFTRWVFVSRCPQCGRLYFEKQPNGEGRAAAPRGGWAACKNCGLLVNIW